MDLKGQLFCVLKIFFAPVKVFNKIKDREKGFFWILPLLIIIIITIVYSRMILSEIVIPEQLEMIPEQVEGQEGVESWQQYVSSSYHFVSSIFTEVAKQLLSFMILAYIICWLPRFFGGDKPGYGTVFTGVVYTGMIRSLGLLIEGTVQVSQTSLEAGWNLAAIFTEVSGLGYHVLRSVSLFNFWQALLLAVMLSVFYGYSKKKSFFIIFILWSLWIMAAAYFSNLRDVYNK